jgi:hypothetical protein
MIDSNSISNRIVDVIVSPDSVIGFIHGALSVPYDLGYLVWGTFDTDSRYRRETERIRALAAIKNGILNYHHIEESIIMVLREFERHVPKNRKNAVYGKASFSVIGRISANSLLTSKITAAVVERATFLVNMRNSLFIGNLLLIGGMMEHCIRTSERLLADNPEIYHVLRLRDYDLLYFLFESAVEPFADALRVKRQQGSCEFEKILSMVEGKIDAG